MENASKALIIAGAILISILLISVGIMVMNSITGVQSQMEGQMDATAIDIFNTKINQYAGSGKRGTQVRGLIDSVVSQNGSYPDNKVTVIYGGTSTSDAVELSALKNQISATKKYDITVTGYDSQTLINQITITDAGSGAGGGSGSTI